MSNLLSVKYKQHVEIPFRVRVQASTGFLRLGIGHGYRCQGRVT